MLDPACWMLDALIRPQVLPFLNRSGSASLRETSATQFQEDSFTLRRKGAKKPSESRYRISSRNLSGFASLRENSAIQSRKELFTPRRQGANEEAFQSKSTIPFLNLSGFASLREPENCVERGLCRNAGEGAAGPSKSVLICGAARHFRFCLLSSYL